MSVDESLDVTDPVSGITAPVACRTLRAHGVEPFFILIGDKPMPKAPSEITHETARSMALADAEKLFHFFYSSLPGSTLDCLIRKLLMEWSRNNLGMTKASLDVNHAIDTLLNTLDAGSR